MESFFSRYRNPMILGIVLLLQVFGLAVQVKRPLDPRHPEGGSVRMIRLWVSTIVTPVERVFVGTGNWFRQNWHDYVNIAGLRHENQQLRAENEQLRINQARLDEEAAQARRLQTLLDFKQHLAIQTVAAQVIGSSGTEQSRLLYIDRGAHAGLKPDMAVITLDGVVGKVRDVFPFTAQVLVLNDGTSGVGALLEKSRLHGVVKGTSTGDLILDHVMVDEKVEAGDRVVTSGGDRIYPKGLPIGTVAQVSPGSDLFLNIRLKPAADLHRLEEVLVVTQPPSSPAETEAPVRAADILAQRLPGVASKQPENAAGQTGQTGAQAAGQGSNAGNAAKGAQSGNPKVAKPPLSTTPPTIPTTTGTPRAKPATSKPGTGTPAAATPSPSAGTSAPAASTPTPTPTPTPEAPKPQ